MVLSYDRQNTVTARWPRQRGRTISYNQHPRIGNQRLVNLSFKHRKRHIETIV